MACALLVGGLLAASPGTTRDLPAQETGTIRGTVRAWPTGVPLSEVKVTMIGAEGKATTARDGTFELDGVSRGVVQIRLEATGFTTSVEQVSVERGLVTELTIDLFPLAVVLDRLTVQGSPHESDRVVRSFRTDPASRVGIAATAADLLAKGFPGVQIRRGSGQVGSGVGILIRGLKSFTLPSEPLVYVDGVLVSGTSRPEWFGTASSLSILEQIPAEAVESIELLKGPATASYGLGAVNGVILIRTYRGMARAER